MDVQSSKQWIWRFAIRHMTRCAGKKGWPARLRDDRPTEEAVHFFASWVKEFDTHNVSELEADQASVMYSRTDYDWPNSPKHLNGLIECVRRVRAAHATPTSDLSREKAQSLCRWCPECSGDGLTSRQFNKHGYGIVGVSLFCMCPAGESLAGRYFKTNIDIYNRIRRLIQYPELWNPEVQYFRFPEEPVPREWPMEPGWIRVAPEIAIYEPDSEDETEHAYDDKPF